jgi:hypothetical protein
MMTHQPIIFIIKFVLDMQWTPCLHHISNNLFPLCDHCLKLVPRIQLIKCHKVFFFLCFSQCNNLPMFELCCQGFLNEFPWDLTFVNSLNFFFLTLVCFFNWMKHLQKDTISNKMELIMILFSIFSCFEHIFCFASFVVQSNYELKEQEDSKMKHQNNRGWRLTFLWLFFIIKIKNHVVEKLHDSLLWLCYAIFLFDYHNGWLQLLQFFVATTS